jgi:spermidine synthase
VPLGTRLAVSLLFLVTGATALVYQVTWLRDLSLVFGASHQATSIVLAAFMAGLALGGFVFGRRSGGWRRPLFAYGLIELLVAASAWALPLALSGIDALYRQAALASDGVGPGLTLLRVALAFAVLVVPTFFMGGTLPLMVEALVARRREFGTRFAWLYGVNTLGGVLGALAAGFALIPALGVRDTQLCAVAVNAAVGALALALAARRRGAARAPAAAAAAAEEAEPLAAVGPLEALPWRLAFVGTAVSGGCALAFEVMWTRALALGVGSTTYSFTVMLAAFLVGIWLGSWLHAAVPLRRVPAPVQFGAVLLALGLASFATSHWIPRLPAAVVSVNALLYGSAPRVGAGTVLLLAFLVMLVPCLFLGLAFPLAGQARARLTPGAGRAAGDTLFVNTLGSIAGSLLAGFALVPALGLQRGMLLGAAVAAAYGVLVLGSARLARARPAARPWIAAAMAAAAGGTLLLPALAPPWDLHVLATFHNNAIWAYRAGDGGADLEALRELDVEYYVEGRSSTVAVVQGGGRRSLLVNGKAVASDEALDLEHEFLLGHLPVLLHPAPRSALVVGLGAGVTLGAVAAHAAIDRLVMVEIEPAVAGAARRFGEVNGNALDAPALEVVFQDGRNYLKTTRERFDVITADPIHPWAYGAAYLYTREYYALARARLREGGVMCQWLPGYELSPADFASVIATFASVFEHTYGWVAGQDLILIGSAEPIRLDLARLAQRLAQPAVRAQLERVGLDAPLALLSEFGMGPAAIRAYADGAVINTDDNMHLEFSSPLTIGERTWPLIMASIQAHLESPRAVLAGFAPRFDSAEAAAAALDRQQRAKWTTMAARSRSRTVENAARQRGGYGPEETGALESAALDLRALLTETPDYAPARLALADILSTLASARLESDPRSAEDLAREAVHLAPEQADARFTLAQVLVRRGLLLPAAGHLEVARRLRPDDWNGYALSSEVLAALGREDEAIAVLREGLARRPHHAELERRHDALLGRALREHRPR